MLGRKSEMRATRRVSFGTFAPDEDGAAELGAAELGATDGAAELGATDGAAELGATVGAVVGATVGAVVGAAVGAAVGACVAAGVELHADAIRTTALASVKSRARIQKPPPMRSQPRVARRREW
jgi:hypothetical protein